MGRQSDNALPLLILFIFMADLLKIRKDTAANWQQNNPVLQAGEPGYETDTNFLKIGDGITAWNELKYFQTDALLETIASGTTTLNAEIGKYYVFAGTVGTLAIALPIPADVTKVYNIGFYMTTGASANVTFSNSGTTVKYYDGFVIDNSKTVEVNALWNGQNWVLAYANIN